MRAGVAIHRLGSARVSRAGECVVAVANFFVGLDSQVDRAKKACFGATPKPTRETVLPEALQCGIDIQASSSLRHSASVRRDCSVL
jgi:hypothetical protein